MPTSPSAPASPMLKTPHCGPPCPSDVAVPSLELQPDALAVSGGAIAPAAEGANDAVVDVARNSQAPPTSAQLHSPPVHLHRKLTHLARAFESTRALSFAISLASFLHDSPHQAVICITPSMKSALQAAASAGDIAANCLLQDSPCACALLAEADVHSAAGNYPAALDACRRAAEAGIPSAHTALAVLLLGDPDRTTRDPSYAAVRLQRGIDAGDPRASVWLSRLLLFGDGVERDEEKAAQMLRAAADVSCREAQGLLGLLLLLGKGVQKDREAAWLQYSRAAKAGDGGGKLGLLLMHFDHLGCHPPFEQTVGMMEEASSESGSGFLVMQAMEKWYKPTSFPADMATVLNLFIDAAYLDNGWAMCCVGFLKERGLGCKQNYDDAMVLYENAIEKDISWAGYLLAEIYRSGRGVKKNLDRVISLLEEIRAMGAPIGAWAAGKLCLSRSKPTDISKAIRLFDECIERGYEIGAAFLGNMCKNGIGIETDFVQAEALFEQAAEAGNPEGCWEMAMFIRMLNNCPLGDAAPDSIVKELLHRAVEGQNPKAMYMLGCMYECGAHVEVSISKAYEYYCQAREQGDPRGILALAKLLVSQKGRVGNIKDAHELFERAFEFGDNVVRAEALFGLAEMNEQGEVIPRNYDRALDLYGRCKKLRIGDVQFRAIAKMGYLYEKGVAVHDRREGLEKAVWLYRTADERGDAFGAYRIGLLYERGKGVVEDVKYAADQYKKASKLGNTDATVRLGRLLEEGRGVPHDILAAVKCYHGAAEYGNREGEFHFGSVLVRGIGVPADRTLGLSYLHRAAMQGLKKAIKLLIELGEHPVLQNAIR